MDNPVVKVIVIALAVVGALVLLAALVMLIGCGMMECGRTMDGMMFHSHILEEHQAAGMMANIRVA